MDREAYREQLRRAMARQDAEGWREDVEKTRKVPTMPWWGWLIGVVVLVALCGFGLGACKSLGSTDAGQVAVLVNGGWFDSKDQRGTVGTSSGYQVPGLYTSWHKYFADNQQRYYQISTDPDKADDPAATAVTVPTRDGVQVQIEALTNFHTTFTGEDDDENLLGFDQEFGFRTFGSEGKHVWDDDGGWEAFLDAQVRPVLVSTFREEIGGVDCEELVPSCDLANQTGEGERTAEGPASTDASSSFQDVQNAIQAKLQTRMDAALGGEYLTGWQVNIEFVSLPPDVQQEINRAQAAFAGIATQRAEAQAAEFEARRTRILAEQYEASPSYALIKVAEVLRDCGAECATVILDASGGNFGLNLNR